MRDCPAWFADELARIGGVNPYGEPVFKLVWSTGERRIVGGRFSDGFVGYRQMQGVPGTPCWALMCWEPRELNGSLDRWEIDYRDEETGLLDCGGYPKHGRYRLLQRFIHREIVRQAKERHYMGRDGKPHTEVLQNAEVVTYRMEPCGFMLDMMLPGLIRWRRLTDAAKIEALLQEEQQRNEEFTRKTKDALEATKLSRTMRSSQLVQKRAEIIERGLKQAMAVAARTGLGMRIAA